MAHGNVSRCEESSLHDVCCGRLSALTDRELSESEPPRHVRRLQFLERMGSCQVVHRGGTRRSC
ncbi:hypothetical protein AI68_04046, partial [Mycobacterium tuberculosis MD18486]